MIISLLFSFDSGLAFGFNKSSADARYSESKYQSGYAISKKGISRLCRAPAAAKLLSDEDALLANKVSMASKKPNTPNESNSLKNGKGFNNKWRPSFLKIFHIIYNITKIVVMTATRRAQITANQNAGQLTNK